jgi:hypothetical protein
VVDNPVQDCRDGDGAVGADELEMDPAIALVTTSLFSASVVKREGAVRMHALVVCLKGVYRGNEIRQSSDSPLA